MCGRFTLTADGKVVQQALGLDSMPELKPRYNVAPSQPIALVTNDAPKTLDYYSWGLIPHWTKPDSSTSRAPINARSETAHEKPTFRGPMKYHRCLIPADGWFEWQVKGKQKTPMYIHMPDYEVFAFAGLWDVWTSPDGSELRTCTILTTDASDDLQDIHHRMPVVLRPDDYEVWLHGDNPEARRKLLKPYAAHAFKTYPVSTRVNSPANDSPENIVPLDGGGNTEQLSLL